MQSAVCTGAAMQLMLTFCHELNLRPWHQLQHSDCRFTSCPLALKLRPAAVTGCWTTDEHCFTDWHVSKSGLQQCMSRLR